MEFIGKIDYTIEDQYERETFEDLIDNPAKDQFQLDVYQAESKDGTPMLVLFDKTQQQFGRLSVNIPSHNHYLDKNQTFIKNWSENEKIARFAIEQGIIRPTGQTVSCGFAISPICDIQRNQKEES